MLWEGILSILLVGTHTPLLDDGTQSFNSSCLHKWIREVLLAFSREIPIREIGDPGIVRCHCACIIESPKCNLDAISPASKKNLH